MKWVSTAQTIRGWCLDVNEDEEFVWSLPSVEIYTSQGEVTVSPPPLRNRNKEKFSCVLFFWVQRSVGFKVTNIQYLFEIECFPILLTSHCKKSFWYEDSLQNSFETFLLRNFKISSNLKGNLALSATEFLFWIIKYLPSNGIKSKMVDLALTLVCDDFNGRYSNLIKCAVMPGIHQ